MQNTPKAQDFVMNWSGQWVARATFESIAAQARRHRALHDDMAEWRAGLGHVPNSQEILDWMDEREGGNG